MAATLKFYIDWFNKRMVLGPKSASSFTPPPFTQGNILPIQVQIIEPDPSGGANDFLVPDISNMALQAVMTAPPVGNVADAPFMTQYAWTKDIVNHIFTANFDFTSALVDAYLAALSNKAAWLEFVIVEGLGKSSIWAGTVTLYATAIKNVAPAPLPNGQIALSLQDAMQRFPQFRLLPGQTITFESPTTGRLRITGSNDDGTAQDDLL